MADALERFFNWQSDGDWFWGPLSYLRPLRTVRMTLRFWLKILKALGFVILVTAPVGGILGGLLVYYDFAAQKHHDTKIPPVTVAENWMKTSSPQAVLSDSVLLIAFCLLGCICQHWAWNRRADRLNRETILPSPAVTAVSGVWPPPPTVPIDGNTMC